MGRTVVVAGFKHMHAAVTTDPQPINPDLKLPKYVWIAHDFELGVATTILAQSTQDFDWRDKTP